MNPIEGNQKAFVAAGSAGMLQPFFMWLFTGIAGLPYDAALSVSMAASALITGLLTYLTTNK